MNCKTAIFISLILSALLVPCGAQENPPSNPAALDESLKADLARAAATVEPNPHNPVLPVRRAGTANTLPLARQLAKSYGAAAIPYLKTHAPDAPATVLLTLDQLDAPDAIADALQSLWHQPDREKIHTGLLALSMAAPKNLGPSLRSLEPYLTRPDRAAYPAYTAAQGRTVVQFLLVCGDAATADRLDALAKPQGEGAMAGAERTAFLAAATRIRARLAAPPERRAIMEHDDRLLWQIIECAPSTVVLDSGIFRACSRALADGQRFSPDFLVAALDAPDAGQRLVALYFTAAQKVPDAVEPLVRRAADPGDHGQYARQALAAIDTDAARAALRALPPTNSRPARMPIDPIEAPQ